MANLLEALFGNGNTPGAPGGTQPNQGQQSTGILGNPFLANLLAQSGYSFTPQSPFGAIGKAALATQGQQRQSSQDDLQKRLIESRIGVNNRRRGAGDAGAFGKINPSDFTTESLAKFQKSQNFADLVAKEGGTADPSAVREFQYFQQLTPEQQEEFLRIKRATSIRDAPGLGIIESNPRGGEPRILSPESTVSDALADRAAAEKEQTGLVTQRAEARREIESIDENLLRNKEMLSRIERGDFQTGPIAGLLPAVTTAQQEFDVFSGENVLDKISQATFGALSEGEREFLRGTAPSRDKTEAANASIVRRRVEILERARARALDKLSSDAVQQRAQEEIDNL